MINIELIIPDYRDRDYRVIACIDNREYDILVPLDEVDSNKCATIPTIGYALEKISKDWEVFETAEDYDCEVCGWYTNYDWELYYKKTCVACEHYDDHLGYDTSDEDIINELKGYGINLIITIDKD